MAENKASSWSRAEVSGSGDQLRSENETETRTLIPIRNDPIREPIRLGLECSIEIESGRQPAGREYSTW